MAAERLSSIRNDQSLAPLLDKSTLLYVDAANKIRAKDKIDTPLDEYGVPRRVELMRQVLATVETAHIWTGFYDVHHAAWEGSTYRSIIVDDEPLGANYRGCSSLKVTLPRQLHNYTHAISHEPPIPPIDVMRQYALEHGQVNRLYDTVKLTSYVDFPDLQRLDHEEKEQLRHESYLRKLETMADGEIGVMPDREYLSRLEVRQARAALRSIARVQGLSNSRKAAKVFFARAA